MIRRVTAGIMGFLLLGILLFSTIYIAVESHHECEGESCPICFIIEQCENTLQQIRSAIKVHLPILLATVAVLFTFGFNTLVICKETPVSRKIQMNN